MQEVKKTIYGSLYIKSLPRGCLLCQRGAKLVLFVTGLCPGNCFYCPLSPQKKGKDVVFANELLVEKPSQVLEEARLMDAEGTGITGGDPLLRLSRTTEYIRLLKEEFGKKHHIHLYTTALTLGEEEAKELADAGLDELRIHPQNPEFGQKIRVALDYGLFVGIEVPALPGEEEGLRKLATAAEQAGAEFINVNELEFTEYNAAALKLRGYTYDKSSPGRALGSEETALKLLEWAEKNLSISVHYCPSFIKDRVQLRNRLRRKSKKIRKPHQIVTRDGLLRYAKVYTNFAGVNPSQVAASLVQRYRIGWDEVFVNEEGDLELNPKLVKRVKKYLGELGLRVEVIEQYPPPSSLIVSTKAILA